MVRASQGDKRSINAKQNAKRRTKKNSKITKQEKRKKQRTKRKLKMKEKKNSGKNFENGKSKEKELTEVEIDDEDLEFFNSASGVSSFANIPLSKHGHDLPKGKRKRKLHEEMAQRKRRKIEGTKDQIEGIEDYEKGERKPKSWDENKQKASNRLPIKLPSGKLAHQQIYQETVKKEEQPEPEIKEPERPKKITKEQKEKAKKKRRRDIRMQIASLCDQLIQDPELKVLRLSHLVTFCSDQDLYVQQMSIISLVEVFRNILPGYRINTKLLEQQTPQNRRQQFSKISSEFESLKRH